MKIVNSISGKIGSYFVGPKCYLKENIRLGEVVICVGREGRETAKPLIWLIGGIEQCIDYISLARQSAEIEDQDATMLLSKLDEAKKKIPKSAMERLASAAGVEVEEIMELAKIAQVCISAPVEGIQEYSDAKPKWLPRTPSYAGIH